MTASGTTLGLRVDVDTFRGTRDGVPRLLRKLDERGVIGPPECVVFEPLRAFRLR